MADSGNIKRAHRHLYCSTGTMVERGNGYDWRTALRNLAFFCDLDECGKPRGIAGAELMMLEFFYDKFNELTREIKASGVPFAVTHCEKEIGTMISRDEDGDRERAFELFKLNCEFAAAVGSERMVVHLWGGRTSDSHFERNFYALNKLCEIIKPYGIKILIENIPCTTADPLTHWRELERYLPEVGFIFDTRFGEFHAQTPAILAEKQLWNGAISHIHISDYTGEPRDFTKLRPILHPGEGHVDYFAIAEGLNENNYNGSITLESPVLYNGSLDIIKLGRSLGFVNDILC